MTGSQLLERARVESEVADLLWRALGFPDVPADEPAFTEDDVRALKIAAEGLEELSGPRRQRALDYIVHETRVASTHLAGIAELFVDSLARLAELGIRRRSGSEMVQRGVADSDVGWLVLYAWRRRMDEAIRRRASAEAGAQPVMVVGFVDLVDFARTSVELDPIEYGRLLDRFEAVAWDEVTEAGGRVVKLIGDEAMFVSAPDPRIADAVLEILGRCGHDGLPPARAGLSVGPVVVRAADYFGPVVNRASRLVELSDAGAAAVDEGMHELLASETGLCCEPTGEFDLKGIGPTDVWSLNAATAGGRLSTR